ncbi:hypothetical protein [Dethiothermospora halolimnae]|uniref:hypothetical protein n=1 Tax=Dethiothermospora halolimnae TaxID=3114390 RepID=UPI003CCC37D8
MNTQGWTRGLMAKNMEDEKFLNHVIDCIGREFDIDVNVCKKDKDYIVNVGEYKVKVTMVDVTIYKGKGPYNLDRFILEGLMGQGFEVDREGSGYLRYCFWGRGKSEGSL